MTARGRAWRALVPVICLVAGFGFAASARTSRGTDLRSPQTGDLAGTVRLAEEHVDSAAATLARIQAEVSAATALAASQDAGVAAAQRLGAPLHAPAGLTAVQGPGVVVTLDDSHDQIVGQVDQNQLVVHQSDMQSVVNALWSGGAEAMSVAGQRLVPTSAVRCVGNTLLLNGQVFSPPFRVAAIGPADTMSSALDRAPGVIVFKQAAAFYGLGYSVDRRGTIDLPAYNGPVGLTYAKAGTP